MREEGALGALWAAALLAGLGVGLGPGCEKGPTTRAEEGDERLPTERLHLPGELRLTNAGRQPRFALRYSLAPSQHEGFRTTVKVDHHFGGRRVRLSATLDWERQILAQVGDAFGAVLEVRRVRWVRPARLRDDVLARLRGLSMPLTIDRRGRLLGTGAKGQSALPAGLDASLLARLSAPLPAEPVGEGARWERRERLTLRLPTVAEPVHLTHFTRYQLVLKRQRGVERFAHVHATLTVTVRPKLQARRATQAVSGSGKGTAELKIDLKTGRLAASKSEVNLALTLERDQKRRTLKQTLKSRTQPLRLRPRPPPGPSRPRPRQLRYIPRAGT